jgi:Prohead core protein serine protease
MKLITEVFEEVEYLSEAKENGEKEHYIHGVFLQGDLKNRNGRIYPIHILDKEVGRYMKEMVKSSRAFGELGHPSGPSINLDRVSHIIIDLKKEGKNYIGKAKLTDTPMGNIAKGLLKSGGKFGVSSRGLGSLKSGKDGAMEVQDDYRLATAADIVHDPSAPHAFVEGIMEGVDWIYDPIKDTWYEEKLENTKKRLNKMTRSQIEEQQLAIFENYIASLTVKTTLI